MKVKEILDILNSKIKVENSDLIRKLQNVGIDADLETEVAPEIVKKLSKVYKVEIKPVKVKKIVEKKEETKIEVEEKSPSTSTAKPSVVVTRKEEEKAVETKIEAKNDEVETTKNVTTNKNKENKNKDTNQEKTNNLNKKEEQNETLELTRFYDDKYDDFEKNKEKTYTRIKNVKKKNKNNNNKRQANVPLEKQKNEKVLYYSEGMTVAKIADGLKVSIGEIVKQLISLGFMVSATQVIDRDTIELLAVEAGYEVKDEIETDITKFENMDFVDDEKMLQERPPIVTIMGHVDHGKTTLLDTIRHSKVVATESGGITQHIGAYQVKKNDKYITFIDTPGHAAFTEMRARGAEVTDIVILVVAADDGIMPQTIEAIEHAKAAKVPIIVAINKMDKPSANPDRIKQELVQYDLVSEDWGGKTIFVPISALTGKGVEELLEMILLVAEMEQYKANPNRLGIGSVIEARLDKGRGPVATILVRNGTVRVGDPIVVGNTYGKIRAMQDETKTILKVAEPSKAIEITGLFDVPMAGDRFMVFEDEKTARLVAEQRSIRTFNAEKGIGKAVSLASLFDNLNDDSKELNLIIKGDVQGSIEALKGSLEKVNVEGVKINIVRSAVGTISDTDISLALASKAIIIGFNIRPNAKMLDEAKNKGIEVRLYSIIYKLLEDIEAAMKGLLDPVYEENTIGQADVRETYKVSKIGTIAGCYVTSGKIVRNCKVRLIRDSIVVYDGKLSSLKRFKDDVKEVTLGYECGLTIENFNDIKIGDVIEAYLMEIVK